MQNKRENITVIGAGLVGSLLAIFLARRGHRVQMIERRPDMRKETISAGRSINLALSTRGIHALKQLGLEQEVLKKSVAMRGRMIHGISGDLTFQAYGKNDSECIYSISRGELNKILLTEAEKTGRVGIAFKNRVTSVDLEDQTFDAFDEEAKASRTLGYTRVIGTDGSASVLRAAIATQTKQAVNESLLDYAYKELVIAPQEGASLEQGALHIWPRGNFMLIALPNYDGSFTCTLFLPLKTSATCPFSFDTLTTKEAASEFFQSQFPDAVPLFENLQRDFFENPTGHMVTVKCSAWNYKREALLMGDAAHAIVPFFGQGMNCGFEDCSVFDELLECGSLDSAFESLGIARKDHADAIADMAVENFVEMRDKVAQPRFLKEKAVEKILLQKFPGEFVSRYGMVTFSRVPYRFAADVGLRADRILSELCADLARPEDVDLARAEVLIREHISPLLKNNAAFDYSKP